MSRLKCGDHNCTAWSRCGYTRDLCNVWISSLFLKVKGKVFYGQEPPSGESTTTECWFNYQQLAVFTEVAQCGAPSCSQPEPATDNGVRDGRFNWLVAPPTLHRAVPPELHAMHTAMRAGLQITRLAALREPRSCDLRNARPTHCLCGHSGYKSFVPEIKGNEVQYSVGRFAAFFCLFFCHLRSFLMMIPRSCCWSVFASC